jgi:hypothetical protein
VRERKTRKKTTAYHGKKGLSLEGKRTTSKDGGKTKKEREKQS